ncbi:MAG: DUF4386 domain-containing protein [Nocardioidaceae bacterium]
MSGPLTQTSPRRAALVAGAGYVAVFVLAIFANFFVRTGLVDPDDARATYANIAESPMLFRWGLVSFVAVFVIDVVIAWALYVLFRAVSQELSLLAAWLRLVYTVFLGVAAIFLFVVVELVSGAAYLTAFDQGQLDAQVTLSMNAFNHAWLIGLASFGLHLLVLGYLVLASRLAPRWLGVVLMAAGTAYIVDTVANALLSTYDEHANLFLALVAVPSVVGELGFTVWLLARGGKAVEHVTAQEKSLVTR